MTKLDYSDKAHGLRPDTAQSRRSAPAASAPAAVDMEGLVEQVVARLEIAFEQGGYHPATLRDAILLIPNLTTALAKLAAERDAALARVHDLDVVVENWRSLHREAKMRAEAAEARASAFEVEARNLIAAWESLPGGANYSTSTIQNWLWGPMKAAFDRARAALSAKEMTGEQDR